MDREELNKYLCEADINIVTAMERIDKNAAGLLFVVDKENHLMGCITDGDIRRWIIKTGNLQALIREFINTSPFSVNTWEEEKAKSIMQVNRISAVPVVDQQNVIRDIIFDSNKSHLLHNGSLTGIPIIIMAGGKGTRLYPYTKILPKPLIPIGEKPIIEHIIDRFTDRGADKFYITVNYKKNMIKSYFEEIAPEYELVYVEEDKPLGTGGSVRLIKEHFTKPVVVTNCDILIEAELSEIYKHHMESGNAITIVASLKNMVIPYGVLEVKEDGLVIGMKEKPRLSNLINTGMYIINPEIIEMIPEGQFYHMTQLAEDCIRRKKRVGIFPISEDSFLDMGEFEEMHRMEEKLNLLCGD